MSKAVMLSIRPKWCEKICGGEKTIEVRKTRPKLETPFKCYIYCTQASVRYQTICGCHVLNSDELYRHPEHGIKHGYSIELMLCENYTKDNFLNGKVIGEFVCDRISPLYNICTDDWKRLAGGLHNIEKELVNQACLTEAQLHTYAGGKNCFAWHISDLKIYDKPKELSEFSRPFENCIDKVCDDFGCASCENGGHIKRPPQSWCYVEVTEDV